MFRTQIRNRTKKGITNITFLGDGIRRAAAGGGLEKNTGHKRKRGIPSEALLLYRQVNSVSVIAWLQTLLGHSCSGEQEETEMVWLSCC